MNWLNKLERKFGRYAIQNLPLYIVILYAFGTIMNLISNDFYTSFALNPFMVLHGEPWRIVTFLVATPGANIIFLVFVMLFYYSIGQSLVHVWEPSVLTCMCSAVFWEPSRRPLSFTPSCPRPIFTWTPIT